MCDKTLSYPIPKPPLSLIVQNNEATMIHPNYSNIDELNSSDEDYIQRQFQFIKQWCESHDVTLNQPIRPYIIDERMTLRQIAYTIDTLFVDNPESYFYIRELTSNTSFGLNLNGKSRELKERFKSVPTSSIQRTGLNQTLQKKGALIFELFQHSIPQYHSLGKKQTQKTIEYIESKQTSLKDFYNDILSGDSKIPCLQSKLTYSSHISNNKSPINLISVANHITLSNEIPCIVYRETRQSIQDKTRIYLPRIHSNLPQDELELITSTTSIQEKNYVSHKISAKRGLFIWNEIERLPLDIKLTGTVQEILQNGDIVIKDSNKNAIITTDPNFIIDKSINDIKLGQQVSFYEMKLVWALTHIHPSGTIKVESRCSSLERVRDLLQTTVEMITPHLSEPMKSFKLESIHVSYSLDISKLDINDKDENINSKIMQYLPFYNGILGENRPLYPLQSNVKWFSSSEQKWRDGVIQGYPNLKQYTVKQGRTIKKLPWTYVKSKDTVSTLRELTLVMERTPLKQFIHPLTKQIQKFREQGLTQTDIIDTLQKVYNIDQDSALEFTTNSLDADLSYPGVITTIPLTNSIKELNINIAGNDLDSILYTYRVIQGLCVRISKDEDIPTIKPTLENDELDEYLKEAEELNLDDMSGYDSDDMSSISSILEDEEDTEQTTASKKDDINVLMVSKLSKFLQALYLKDPVMFQWSSSSKDKSRYASICQESSRQPKLISDNDKTQLEQDDDLKPGYYSKSFAVAAGLYDTHKDELEKETVCDSDSLSTMSEETTKCVAIRHGYSANKQWYVCPRIYDIYEEIPVRLQDLTFETPFTPLGWKGSDWRTDKTTKKDILDFGPSYKGRKPVINLKQQNYKEHSLYFQPVDSHYFYPGLLSEKSHPRMFQMPCCFIEPNRRLHELFGIEKTKQTVSQKYIQSWKRYLTFDPPRYGLINPLLQNYFKAEPKKYKTGPLQLSKSSQYETWLRRSIRLSKSPFLSCVAQCIGGDNYTETKLIKSILSYFSSVDMKLPNKQFQFMNYGDIQLQMLQKYTDYQPLQAYLLHLLFTSNLSWVDTLDAISIRYPKHIFILFDSTDAGDPILINTTRAYYHYSQVKRLQDAIIKGKSDIIDGYKVHFCSKDGVSWSPIYKITNVRTQYSADPIQYERGTTAKNSVVRYWLNIYMKQLFKQSKITIKSQFIGIYPSMDQIISLVRSMVKTKDDIKKVMYASTIFNSFVKGVYHPDTGFIPFYITPQTNVAIKGITKLISKSQLKPISHYFDFYRHFEQSPLISQITDSSTNKVHSLSTVYGVYIPVLESNPISDLPVVYKESNIREEDAYHPTIKHTQPLIHPMALLKQLDMIENNYGKLNDLERKDTFRFIPYRFIQRNDGIIDRLEIVVLRTKDTSSSETSDFIETTSIKKSYNNQKYEQLYVITIGIFTNSLSETDISTMKRRVGIVKDTSAIQQVIQYEKNISLEEIISVMDVLRMQSQNSIPISFYQYNISDGSNKVIGLMDSFGFDHRLHNDQSIFIGDTMTNQFILKPLLTQSEQDNYEINSQEDVHEVIKVLHLLYKTKYWRSEIDTIQPFARTATLWKYHRVEILALFDRITKEITKRLPNITKCRIKQILYYFVYSMEWDTLSLEKFYNGQFNLAIPETKLEVYPNEFLMSGTDVEELYTLSNQYQPLESFHYIEYDGEINRTPVKSLPILNIEDTKEDIFSKTLVRKTAIVGSLIPQSIILRKPDPSIKMDIIDSNEELKLEVKIRNHESIVRAFVLE